MKHGISLVVQCLRLRAPDAGGLGLIPGQGTRACILQLRPGMAQKKAGYETDTFQS